MTCSHCDTWNPEDEHRCRRCGRRLNGSRDNPLAPVTGNLAASPAPARPPQAASDGPQARLFDAPASNVIPFTRPGPPQKTPRPAPRRDPMAPRPPENQNQQQLDFLPPALPTPRTLATTVEAVIFCDTPVATLTHRIVAATLDFVVILFGYALFLGAFRLAGGEFRLDHRGNMVLFVAALPMLAAFYGAIWTLAGTETPGMHWTGLRLTNFDGFPPESGQRALRYLGSCLSFASIIGLLWAAVDEESLTWQDHISKTFPTFRVPDSNFVRRR